MGRPRMGVYLTASQWTRRVYLDDSVHNNGHGEDLTILQCYLGLQLLHIGDESTLHDRQYHLLREQPTMLVTTDQVALMKIRHTSMPYSKNEQNAEIYGNH